MTTQRVCRENMLPRWKARAVACDGMYSIVQISKEIKRISKEISPVYEK